MAAAMSFFGLVTVSEMKTAIANAIREVNMDISQLQSDVGALQTAVSAASDELEKLASMVKNITPENFTQADIDALDAQVKAARDSLNIAVQSAETQPPTP
jgi:outer membrane murein-binding lipoprotein Lpp